MVPTPRRPALLTSTCPSSPPSLRLSRRPAPLPRPSSSRKFTMRVLLGANSLPWALSGLRLSLSLSLDPYLSLGLSLGLDLACSWSCLVLVWAWAWACVWIGIGIGIWVLIWLRVISACPAGCFCLLVQGWPYHPSAQFVQPGGWDGYVIQRIGLCTNEIYRQLHPSARPPVQAIIPRVNSLFNLTPSFLRHALDGQKQKHPPPSLPPAHLTWWLI